MTDAIYFYDKLDEARLRRAKELSEIKVQLGKNLPRDREHVFSKSAVVLSYASWEGFYNEAANIYLDFLVGINFKISDAYWNMNIGHISSIIQSLRDKHHSFKARMDFVRNLKTIYISDFDQFDRNVVLSRSNLDFEKLTDNFRILYLDINKFQKNRIRIDKELVGWRHGVAHGDQPDLTSVDIKKHVDFTASLLLDISDSFHEGIARHK